ncbi:MAG: trigger factor [Micrococcales bacterium]|jgi:trigger factor|nr:trigger factor [Micrococcales bacterium]MDG1817888.1 trigger factor [Aquiluna sp.]MBT5398510.1 trigger factor [Micrococcales bacterium]MBT5430920.1 trigger factor [Micrococcales bacterium]MBT5848263.1 trigger factor [Micrococcales bacterium]
MLKTTVERLNPTRVKLTIEVDQAAFKPTLDKAYETVAQQVNIPGFRKGKVPSQVLDQRVGKDQIIAQAINDGMDVFYRQALVAEKLKPLGTPEADISSAPSATEIEKPLIISLEVEVRPEFKLPDYKGIAVTVEPVKVAKMDIETELDALRARFGSLVTVDRPAAKGDFTTIDLSALMDGKQIDTASDISYEIGSGQLLDGIDEALETLTAGETTTFKSKLVGGEMAGQEAEVTVTLKAVKERELPKADDEFAQLASEFDTLAELKKDLETKIAEQLGRKQVLQARDKIVEDLVAKAKIPVSDIAVKREVDAHLEGEGRMEDDVHRKEVTADSEKGFKTQLLLDAVVDAEEIKIEDQELIEYLAFTSRNYQMDPNQFIEQVASSGQVAFYADELARRKAVDFLVAQAVITDTKGAAVKYEV